MRGYFSIVSKTDLLCGQDNHINRRWFFRETRLIVGGVYKKIWNLGHGAWLQDDENQCFLLQGADGKSFSPDKQQLLPVVVGARFHESRLSDKPCAAGAYPAEFEHCPFCGSRLQTLTFEQPSWFPPYGPTDGLRIIERSGFSKSHRLPLATEFALPRLPGVLSFLVAQLGTVSTALLAVNRTNNQISVYDPATRQWVDLERTGILDDSLDMPDWSWSIACGVNQTPGFCWPTATGPAWVEFDWSQQRYSVTMGPGRCIGGAATLGGKIYVPTKDNAQVKICVFSPQTRQWSAIPLQGTTPENEEFLSVPTVDASRSRIHWVGQSGRLSLRSEGEQAILFWRPWETDAHPCHALPEYGPPYYDRIRNRYWQLCYDEHDQAYRYYEIEGDEHTDLHDNIEGDVLSTGDASFSKEHDHWKAPWDTPTDDRADDIRIPLLQFRASEKDSTVVTVRLSGEQLIWELFANTKEHLVRFSIESKQDLPKALELPEKLKIKRPWECKAFIFEDCLHIYVPDRFKCYRWPLNQETA